MDDGSVLKVGISRNGIRNRWTKTLDVIPGVNGNRKLRPNEENDGRKLLQYAGGHRFTVWYKDSLMIKIPYDQSGVEFPAHGAEEIFLDRYFRPKFGKPLSRLPNSDSGIAGESRSLSENPVTSGEPARCADDA
jgi:hypothetical protein